jgi:hypothetical protein
LSFVYPVVSHATVASVTYLLIFLSRLSPKVAC